VQPRDRHVLLVEPSDAYRAQLAEMIGGERVFVSPRGTAAACCRRPGRGRAGQSFDLIITGLDLPT
jgi:hypothetical protein